MSCNQVHNGELKNFLIFTEPELDRLKFFEVLVSLMSVYLYFAR